MYDPKSGRWLSQDPIGFDAGDTNLYRYVGNSSENRIDPSGTDTLDQEQREAEELGIGDWDPKIFARDMERMAEKGDSKAWEFIKQGCVGLAKLRTGSYKEVDRGVVSVMPQLGEGVHIFWKLEDAIGCECGLVDENSRVKAPAQVKPVLFAIGSKNDITKIAKPLGDSKTEIDPKSLADLGKLEPYSFATAFQDKYWDIQFWETMPGGLGRHGDARVEHTPSLPRSYNFVFAVRNTDSTFAPPVVPTRKK